MKEKKSAAKTLEEITDFDSLYDRSRACQSNVTWKPQVKHFILNDTDICLGMEDRLRNGAWRHAKPRQVLITYPKPRKGLCIPFTDRVYQRALNDLSFWTIAPARKARVRTMPEPVSGSTSGITFTTMACLAGLF
jgi:hypothetical protein